MWGEKALLYRNAAFSFKTEFLLLREITFITAVKPISHRKINTQKTVTQLLISLNFKCPISFKTQTFRHQSVLVKPINSRDSCRIQVFGKHLSMIIWLYTLTCIVIYGFLWRKYTGTAVFKGQPPFCEPLLIRMQLYCSLPSQTPAWPRPEQRVSN